MKSKLEHPPTSQTANSRRETVREFSLLSADDLYWFNEGTHHKIYEKFGAHLVGLDGAGGACFTVWAPNAAEVFVMGDFNGWNNSSHPLRPVGQSGVWSGFVPGIRRGAAYKYHLHSRQNHYRVDKADPCGIRHETAPKTASLVWDLDYEWNDAGWMKSRGQRQKLNSPISIYEMHLGSWQRVPEDKNRRLTYRELAPKLADYVEKQGFTHVEFLPVMKHPFYGS